jgi:hypothetical protein
MRNSTLLIVIILLFGCNNVEKQNNKEREEVLTNIIVFDLKFKFDSTYFLYPTLNGNINKELMINYINSFDTIFTSEDKEYMIQQYTSYSSNIININFVKSCKIDVCHSEETCKNLLFASTPMITINKQHSMTYVSLKKNKVIENWIFIHHNKDGVWELIGMRPC